MIDISDGLSSELLHICTQSKVGCRIYEERIHWIIRPLSWRKN